LTQAAPLLLVVAVPTALVEVPPEVDVAVVPDPVLPVPAAVPMLVAVAIDELEAVEPVVGA
jgi:hypothetical protein